MTFIQRSVFAVFNSARKLLPSWAIVESLMFFKLTDFVKYCRFVKFAPLIPKFNKNVKGKSK